MGEVAAWRWDEATWRGHVEHIRAGRTLSPEWPRGNRVAVALSFDSDHETIPLRDGEIGPGKLSQGEFGARVGARRILALLADGGIPATFPPAAPPPERGHPRVPPASVANAVTVVRAPAGKPVTLIDTGRSSTADAGRAEITACTSPQPPVQPVGTVATTTNPTSPALTTVSP